MSDYKAYLPCFSIYGYLYLMFTTFPTLFSVTYGWGPGISGLAFLGPGIGFMTATIIGARLLSKLYVTVRKLFLRRITQTYRRHNASYLRAMEARGSQSSAFQSCF
jgi:uncharacterized membrane protein YwaF